jgi:hypothetical protein
MSCTSFIYDELFLGEPMKFSFILIQSKGCSGLLPVTNFIKIHSGEKVKLSLCLTKYTP